MSKQTIRRNRIFRDGTHPLEIYNDEQIYTKFRFYRHIILQLTDEVRNGIEFVLPRKGSLTPILQVLLTLRFYATPTGTLQNVIGKLLGVDQSTVSRIVNRVTNAFLRRMNQFIVWPDQRKADENKRSFYRMRRFPNVIGCVDGTHVRIQTPFDQEHEFVNRKNYHSINVQVSYRSTVCNVS